MSNIHHTTTDETSPAHVPWFGSKRIGWGLRPQTWQGWAVIVAFVVVCILIGWLVTGRP